MLLVDLKYNFGCGWFVELSDNKLSYNNLASELVGNGSLLNQSQLKKLWFLWLISIYHREELKEIEVRSSSTGELINAEIHSHGYVTGKIWFLVN